MSEVRADRAGIPSPLAGEGVMRSMTDEGSGKTLKLGATPHPVGSADHPLPQGERVRVFGMECR
jgi:hypothetical protein